MIAPQRAKMTKKAEGAWLAMTARGNVTHHERAAAMVSCCLVTAKKLMAPTEMAMTSHPEGLVPSEWPRTPAIAARTLGSTSSLEP